MRVKELDNDIRALKTVPEDRRLRLGIDTQIQVLLNERDSLLKARREAKPASARLTSRSHAKRMARRSESYHPGTGAPPRAAAVGAHCDGARSSDLLAQAAAQQGVGLAAEGVRAARAGAAPLQDIATRARLTPALLSQPPALTLTVVVDGHVREVPPPHTQARVPTRGCRSERSRADNAVSLNAL